MRLVIAGCEYSGTSTLAFAIDDWLHEKDGSALPPDTRPLESYPTLPVIRRLT